MNLQKRCLANNTVAIKLAELNNIRVTCIYRVCDMLCICSEDEIYDEESAENASKYEIHCQCAWRLFDSNDKMVFASDDVYLPASHKKAERSFKWDESGANLFDEELELLFRMTPFLEIHELHVTSHTDVVIDFKNGYRFEAYTNSSQRENWRIFKRGERPWSIVVSGYKVSVYE